MRLGESKLPGEGPAPKGVSLDPGIPGTSTFAKPSGEDSRQTGTDDESIYRVEDADDLTKSQSRSDEIDLSDLKPTYRIPGPHDGPNKTKYPYRDGVPNAHNASMVLRVAYAYLEDPMRRAAARLSEIETGLNPKTVSRANQCSVTVKRADVRNLRWLFVVDCGNGAKIVRLKATRKGKVISLSKMDLHFTCTCHAWRWLGSEHHALREDYLDGKPRGTATVPVVKDPLGVNRVCKHVAAVSRTVRKWTVPLK